MKSCLHCAVNKCFRGLICRSWCCFHSSGSWEKCRKMALLPRIPPPAGAAATSSAPLVIWLALL